MQGKTINGYTLKQQLGKGGMAEVWLGENALGKKAAVKLLLPKFCNDEVIVARFQNEAKVMVQLDHPNIRQVYDYGNIDGRPCILMEYLEGDDLKALMKSGRRFTQEELVKWWNQIADALNYTHAQGVVHRDIKPSNIFLDQKGNIKLLDFGIAKIRESISMTQTGAMMGTLIYMSPEQVDDAKHLGPESDVYSLAVTFVHLLSGKAPYDSTTMSDFKIRESIVYKPLDLSGVPAAWQGFISPYLEKEPDKRPALRSFDASSKQVIEKPVPPKAEKPPVAPVPLNDEETQIAEMEPPKPKPEAPKAETSTSSNGQRKSKKGLWIGLVLAIAAAVAVWLFVKPDDDTKAFNECQTVNDYRSYIRNRGQMAKHYAEAQQIVDKHVADSVAEAKEKASFDACTTIAACDNYLKAYPQGRYVKEVNDKKLKLEAEERQKEDDAFNNCKTLADCDNYLKAYPTGRYVDPVKTKKAELEEKVTVSSTSSGLMFTVKGVTFVMKKVEGGTFQMGAQTTNSIGQNYDSEAFDDEKPVHSVTLSTYYIGETEVTQALWKAVMGSNPSNWKGDNLPVEQVSWNDCKNFIRKLNQLTGKNFRLPTEAEWEYAARGGKKSNGKKYAGSGDIGSVAWYDGNSGSKTHPVKGKSPNELGLYDMSGNVWEWCGDWYGSYGSGSQTNPKGSSSGSGRVLRGGGWSGNARDCRVSIRGVDGPGFRSYSRGFRLALIQ